MLKEKIFSICCVMVMGLTFTSCNDSIDNDGTINDIFPTERYPLTAFAVKVDGSFYHGKIDQSADPAIVRISHVQDASKITDVWYELETDNAHITPDPKSFIDKWEKEQTVTIVTENQVEKVYKIELSDFVAPEPEPEPKPIDPESNIIFEDDFDYVFGTPDADKWVLCRKGGSSWNNEMSESYDQAYLKDGVLVLEAIKDKETGEYKAGGIESRGKFGFTFGKVEVRAKIVKSPNGAFPAIWMMPQKVRYPGWPDCGEIDIMEHLNQEGHIWQTIHSHDTKSNRPGRKPNHVTPKCNYWEYNVYGMEWTPNDIRFFLNGKQTMRYAKENFTEEQEEEFMQWPFNEEAEFYLMLNMALGGVGEWPGPIDGDNLPAIMHVDWVRVYANEYTIRK